MERLLHERMRECANLCIDEIRVNDLSIGPFYPIELNTLADEIERCYHPKPVDGDGKPWELGDDCITAEGEDATIVGYRPGGRVFIDLHDEREFARCYASDLKRTLKVLDADGVEIKVGDTVYNVYTGTCVSVIEIASNGRIKWRNTKGGTGFWVPKKCTHERPVFDADGVRICEGDTVWHVGDSERGTVISANTLDSTFHKQVQVKVAWDNGNEGFYRGDFLTHREPDSLEKLRDERAYFPTIASEDWCGEHEPLEDSNIPVASPAPWNEKATKHTCPDCGTQVILDSPNESVNQNYCHCCGLKFERGA